MPAAIFPFPFSRIAAMAIAACAAVVLQVAPADAQKTPDISLWKTVLSKAVGVSCLMPPGTVAADPGLPFDAKKGARIASVIFDAPDAGGKQTYGLVAVRANQAALGDLLAQARASGEPVGKKSGIDLLYEAQFKPLINDAIGWVGGDRKRIFITRKPITWRTPSTRHTLDGEEIQITKRAAPGVPAAFLHIRIVKEANSIFMITAGEKNATPEAFARARRVFDSFTIVPGGTFVKPRVQPMHSKPTAKP